jgi:hypothetical protein
MTESNASSQKRSNKFSLTVHKTGRYCKKIRSEVYCFGIDKKHARERYLEQAAFRHAGRSSSYSHVPQCNMNCWVDVNMRLHVSTDPVDI